MIPLNQEQTLGEKAYLLLVSKKMMPGVILLLVAAILLSLKSIVQTLLYSVFAKGGQVSATTAATISSALVAVILGFLVVSLVVLLIGIVVARLQYRNTTYTFEEFNLCVRRGILRRTETSIPYRQIQDVDVDRSLVYQMMGLSRLTIITAGHEEVSEHERVEVVLEPLQKEVASDIREMLERKIGVQVVTTVAAADAAEKPASAVPISTPQ